MMERCVQYSTTKTPKHNLKQRGRLDLDPPRPPPIPRAHTRLASTSRGAAEVLAEESAGVEDLLGALD